MAREITLTGDELEALQADLESGKLSGDDKVIGQAIVDRANAERTSANTADAGWYFSWTYRF